MQSRIDTGLEDDLNEVESILRKRINEGKVQYFIKWKGYGKKYNSWVDEDTIFAEDLINEFEKKKRQKKKKEIMTQL